MTSIDHKFTQINKRIRNNKDSILKTSEEIKKIKAAIEIKKPRPAVKIKSNIEISLRKAQIKPNFNNKTVLTDSTWHYVELFLKRNKGEEALNYWHQAQNFFKATETLDLLSKPLTTYYCFLNATKALLTFKKIGFDTRHGVSGKSTPGQINLINEIVYLHPRGVLSGLCNYLEEPVVTISVPNTNKRLPESYTLKDILYNLEYIHRAYNLTYSNQTELFVPIEEPRFVHDKSRKKGWIELRLEPEYSTDKEFAKITGFGKDFYYDQIDYYTLRLNKEFKWDAPRNNPTTESLQDLSKYYKNHRKRFRYIYSANKLWYIKRKNLTNGLIDRGTLPLTFAAMHRLSEMSRYDPNTLEKHLEKSYGWLLSEFITKSIHQFVDMVSSEITGDDFRVTGFRT
ncbi:YaaC family protein [Bacillus halotolerans]|uniref:YaaC family protein n=1 Tax=Bacillus halotolerans TaxID=260554 RepID=UPI0037D261F8